MRCTARLSVVVALVASLLAGCDQGSSEPSQVGPTVTSSAGPSPSENPEPDIDPASVLGLAAADHQGDRLRLGAVRERTASYTSYDVTFRSRSVGGTDPKAYRISGVLNVPRGRGPFPAAVLAHGYIDPAVYVRGQGMTRERGYLAERGYIALHVDYRNHAESDVDRTPEAGLRLGYSADVVSAVKALRGLRSPLVRVDDDRIFFFGRSMGGSVVLKALVAEPGLVRGAALWASVSSLESENAARFLRSNPDYVAPSATVMLANSSRPYFDRITEPVLLVHGRHDDTCPPRWARATHRALVAAGVDAQLAWYDDGHAFGPQFDAAMRRTVRFFDAA